MHDFPVTYVLSPTGCQALGFPVKSSEVAEHYVKMDKKDTGYITFDAFCAFIVHRSVPGEHMRRGLSPLDEHSERSSESPRPRAAGRPTRLAGAHRA